MAAPKLKSGLRKRQLDAGSSASPLSIHYAVGEHVVAESVATLLLIEEGLRRSGMALGDLATLLDRPSSVVVLRAGAPGFAASALRLLDDGALLPGRTQTLDAAYVRPGGHVRFSDDLDIRWRIVTMLVGTGDDEPDDESESEMRARIANVARAGYPLLVLAETAPIPSLLSIAADRVVGAGGLDACIIEDTIVRVAGHDAGEVRSALADASFSPARLSVADLSVAIRPGVPLDRMIETLTHLTATGDDDDENDAGGGDGATSTRSGSRSAWQGDRDWDRQATTLSKTVKGKTERARSGRSRTDNGKSDKASASGTAVILPTPITDAFVLTVETLAGYGAAKDWALALKADLALWKDGTLTWDQLSSRLLLSGPPGTGKTTFARALCNSLDLPLHVSSVSTWLEPGYLGSVIMRMGDAFEEARMHAPSILFIDEADGIGKRQPQTRDFADYWNALVNKMLELMDGAAKAEGVIIVGATNRPEAMDAALKRSGRWEVEIAIPMPDREALVGIIEHHIGPDLAAVTGTAQAKSPMPHRRDEVEVVLTRLARQAAGLSGADVERLVREARGKARRQGRSLSHADLATGLAQGRPTRPRDLRYRMAIHEAGHALVRRALKVGTEVGLSIEANTGGYAEAMLDLQVVQSAEWVTALIAVHLAGRAAEMLVFGNNTIGSGGTPTSDLANATRLALSMEIELGFGASRPLLHRSMESAELLLLRDDPLSHAVHDRLEAAFALATRTIEADRATLLSLADALTEAGSLNAAEIAAVFAAAKTVGNESSVPDLPEPPA